MKLKTKKCFHCKKKPIMYFYGKAVCKEHYEQEKFSRLYGKSNNKWLVSKIKRKW